MLRCYMYIAVSVFVSANAFPENAKVISNETILDGVKTETHRVITDDLYILHVLRMQHVNTTRHNHSVLLLHGMGGSSDTFTGHGRNLSLAYSLVDAGFDVWSGNVRGNKYSRHHVFLNPDDPVDKRKFFNYTYENIGLFDIPATVDYILKHTNTTKLHYIGHSQGGTAFLVLNSMRPEYNEKFISAQLLAAAGYNKHFSHTVLFVLSKIAGILYKLLTDLGIVEWHYLLTNQSSHNDTNKNQIDMCLGKRGYNEPCEILNEDGLLGAPGSGGAIKQQVHFGQNIHSREFRRWDFGTETNLLVYGSTQPPNYNLSLITVPTAMHYGPGDIIVNSRDVLEMAWQMPNAEVRKVPRVDFGHSDFVDAPDAPELVYESIIDTMLYFEDNKVRVWTSPASMSEPPHFHYPADTIGWDIVPMDPNRSTCNFLSGALLLITLTLKLI